LQALITRPQAPPSQKFGSPCITLDELAVVLQIWPQLRVGELCQPDCQAIAKATAMSEDQVQRCLMSLMMKRMLTSDGIGFGRGREASCALHLTHEEQERYAHLSPNQVYVLDSEELRDQLLAKLAGTFQVVEEEMPREEENGGQPLEAGVFTVSGVIEGQDGGDPPETGVIPKEEGRDEEVAKGIKIAKLVPGQLQAALVVLRAGGTPMKGHEVGKVIGLSSATIAQILQSLAKQGVLRGEGKGSNRQYSPGAKKEFILVRSRKAKAAPEGLEFGQTYDLTELVKERPDPAASPEPAGGEKGEGKEAAGEGAEALAAKPPSVRALLEDLEAGVAAAKKAAQERFAAIEARLVALKVALG